MEGRNVSRGIGSGAAQIYNSTQNAVNTYARTIAQQQAKRDAEQKALQDDLAKVKIDGIRQGDIPEFTTKYNEAKDIHAKLVSAKNSADKIKLDRDFKTRMLELGEIAQDSKALAKGEEAFTGVLLNPNVRDRYKEDSVSQFQLSKSLSRKDPRFIRDLTKLEQQVDLSGFTQKVNSIRKTLLESERPVRSETAGTQGNRSGVYVTNTKSVSPEKQAIAYAMEFDIDPKFRGAMRQMFPQFANLDMADLKAKAIPELINLMPIEAFKEEEFKANEDKSLELERLKIARANLALRQANAEGGSSGEPISMTIPFAKGTGSFTSDEYVPISLPKRNFAGSSFIDLKTGKPSAKKLPSSGDYEIVGVTNVPIINDRIKDKSLVGAVSQPNFARENPQAVVLKPMIHVQLPTTGGGKSDYLIPYDRFPENVKSTDAVKNALDNFRPATQQSTTQPTKVEDLRTKYKY
jgi:hypothetical protein